MIEPAFIELVDVVAAKRACELLGKARSTHSATLSGTATQPANPVINLTGTAGAPAGGSITFKLYGPDN